MKGKRGGGENANLHPRAWRKTILFFLKWKVALHRSSSSCAQNLIRVCFLITTIFLGHIKISFLLLLLGKAQSAKFKMKKQPRANQSGPNHLATIIQDQGRQH